MALLAAPAAFAALEPSQAGRYVARLFEADARMGLLAGVVLLVLLRRVARQRSEARLGSLMSADLLLVLAAMACVIAGQFVVQPLMGMARAGTIAVSFGALHGISMVLYAAKALLLLALAWRHASGAPAGGVAA